mgnify:CR=1 FL=1
MTKTKKQKTKILQFSDSYYKSEITKLLETRYKLWNIEKELYETLDIVLDSFKDCTPKEIIERLITFAEHKLFHPRSGTSWKKDKTIGTQWRY